jgi:hypothetical protein
MVLLSTNRIAWTYTDDLGNDWRVAAPKAVTDQAKLGGSAAAASVLPLPFGYKMRRTTVRNAAQSASRSVPVYKSDAAILTAAETVTLNHLADSYAFTWGGSLIAEKRPRRSTTAQAA